MILLDSSALFALVHRGDDLHERAVEFFRQQRPRDFATTLPILTEVSHLLEARAGPGTSALLVDRIGQGAFPLLEVVPGDLVRAAEIDRAYADLELGFVDSLSLALCERLGMRRVFTFDRRDFLAYRLPGGEALIVLPD